MYTFMLLGAEHAVPVTALLQENSQSRGGQLTGEFELDVVRAMLTTGMPVAGAWKAQSLVGVLFSAPINYNHGSPVVREMFRQWPGGTGAYLYGPVCVAASERGKGLLAGLFACLCQGLRPDSEAVLFIGLDNEGSIRAHRKLGMRQVAVFTLDGHFYGVFTDAPPPLKC